MKKLWLAAAVSFLASGAAFAQTTDTLAKIGERGAVNLGVRDSSGLAFTLGGGKYVGFHTEMAERIVDDISKQLGKPLTINYQVITSQNRIPLIQNGTIDFECGSTTNSRARQKDVDFAYTTYVEEVRMAVNTKSGIKSINDLGGKTLAVTTGTTSVQHIRKKARDANLDFKQVMGKDHADSFLLLESGRADAFVMDGSILAANIAKAKNPKDFAIVGEVLSVEPIACMLPKGDAKLKKAIDDSIERQVKDGSLAKLYDKWFMQPIPPNNVNMNMPVSESTKNAWANLNDKPMEDYGN
ncbi:transporter substrate-binding domain-containing protein [Comamonas sp. NLF-1-9]|uniref:transporter substrate-binding domain-containing protein n=1 Tax=Comamonas sp. NLF-1-9 TaxID=2853163 RepID=UPI001C4888BA|nr:transporter substrate-binding domain-containing protein [Comamonas sp. NLF-1-9]QXL84436.1 transporter substrate-binding domain-containing protein [Comamonas sp. NLF-1-9]